MNNPLINIIIALTLVITLPTMSTAHAQSGTNASTKTSANASADDEQAPSPPTNPHKPDAPTLAELQGISDEALSDANTELLAKNAELQSRVDELTTQVNVLVNERSGQLFLYGALTVIVSFILGFALARLLFIRRKDW